MLQLRINSANKIKQEKAKVRFATHQASNTHRQCRWIWCGFGKMVRFGCAASV